MTRTDFYEELLSALLDCGTADVSIIADTSYDMDDMVEKAKDYYGDVTLENLACAIIEQGIIDFEEAMLNRIETIETEYDNFAALMNGLDDDEYEDYIIELDEAGELTMEQFRDMDGILQAHRELVALKELNVQEDISYYFNCLDTHAYFCNNEELYREYCSDMIDEFESNTGFSL